MSAVDLSVVVPVYNNAATLDELIDRLHRVLASTGLVYELIFVDDGSRDDSWGILQAHTRRDPRVRTFAMVRNYGSQSAVCAGFDQVRGRWAVCMDADLENRPEDIPTLLQPLSQGYDLVCGYRENRDAPWLTRRLPSWLMNAYVRRQTGVNIRDAGCGMRSFQSWVIRDLGSEGEARRLMTPLFLKRARRVTEAPVQCGAPQRTGGHSFLSLLGIAVDYFLFTTRRPFLITGLTSLAVMLTGVPYLALAATLPGTLMVCTGLLGLVMSLVGEYCQRLYQLAQGQPFYKIRTPPPEEGAVAEGAAAAGTSTTRSAAQCSPTRP